MVGKIRRLLRTLLTMLGVGMVMYSALNLPVESYWRTTNTLRNTHARHKNSENHKIVHERKNNHRSLDKEKTDINYQNQVSEWDFLVDLPVRVEEEDESEESTELNAALNLPMALLKHTAPSSMKWHNRVDLADFPRMMKCKGNTARGDNSLVYPCRPKRHVGPVDTAWPTVLEPSNGALLRRISQRRYDDLEVEQLVEEQLDVQMKRLSRVAKTCKAQHRLQERQNLSLVWAGKRTPPLVYCPIYKSASTTWMTNFLRLEHLNDNNPRLEGMSPRIREHAKYMPRFGGGHQRVFKDYPKPKTSSDKRRIFEQAVRFLVVRHPFDRLVSVYRDKIGRPNPLPFRPYFQDLQQAIVARYRAPGDDFLPPQPTFSEFVDYLIESTENLQTVRDWTENVICWTPYWVQCGVCSSDYQVIIKVETMKSDEQLLAHVANLTEIQDGSQWENKRPGPPPDYFKSLTKVQVEALYLRYKVDFDLFGYTIGDYLDAAIQV